jgi:hypothetical protein
VDGAHILFLKEGLGGGDSGIRLEKGGISMGRLLRRLGGKPDPRRARAQALEQARRRHEELTERARVLREKLGERERELGLAFYVVEELPPSIQRGLVLADQARAAGDETQASSYEEMAGFIVDSLSAAQVSLEEAKILYDSALESVGAAERAVEESASLLEEAREAMDGEDRSPPPGDPPSFVDVERTHEELEARYGHAVREAEAACAAVRRRRPRPDGGDTERSPEPPPP